MALREQFVETVTAPMGMGGSMIPIQGIATTVFGVNPDGTEGTQATAFAGRTGATVASSLVTDASGRISYWLDPGEYNVHFSDQQSPPRISAFIRGFAAVAFSQAQIIAANQTLPIGTVAQHVGTSDPVDPDGVSRWMIMDGRPISRLNFPALFALLNAETPPLPFGIGNGTSTFNIPDSQGRVLVNKGVASGGTAVRTFATKSGAEVVTLSNAQMPVHNHTGVTQAGATTAATGGASTGAKTAGDHSHWTVTTAQNVATASGGGSWFTAANGASITAGSFPYIYPGGITSTQPVEHGNQTSTVIGGGHSHDVAALSVPGLIINSDGGSGGVTQPFSNMPPFLVVNHIIKVL